MDFSIFYSFYQKDFYPLTLNATKRSLAVAIRYSPAGFLVPIFFCCTESHRGNTEETQSATGHFSHELHKSARINLCESVQSGASRGVCLIYNYLIV
jgi:hypothetical protein